jgi:hypothetical protein
MVMAGLMADVQSWANFSDDWQECLDMKPRLSDSVVGFLGKVPTKYPVCARDAMQQLCRRI